MGLRMSKKMTVSREVAKRYQRAGKKEKGRILLMNAFRLWDIPPLLCFLYPQELGEENSAKGKRQGKSNLSRR